MPAAWLGIGAVFLIGFRVGLNVVDSNVIDVGYAGVIGADQLRLTARPLYGHFPLDNQRGDTYGPVLYYAYVPFEALLPWSGRWDDLPAAHAAAVAFDLLTACGLFLLGRRLRGPDARRRCSRTRGRRSRSRCSSPNSNSNDALVGAAGDRGRCWCSRGRSRAGPWSPPRP